MDIEKNVEEFKRLDHEVEIFEQGADAAEAKRWRMAELAYLACAKGRMPQQTYADKVGKTQSFISHCIAIWKQYGLSVLVEPNRPRFWDAIAMQQRGKSNAEHQAALRAKREAKTKALEAEVERTHVQLILAALKSSHNGRTDNEIAEQAGLTVDQVIQRRGELKREGKVVDSGATRTNPKTGGRLNTVWTLPGDGTSAERAHEENRIAAEKEAHMFGEGGSGGYLWYMTLRDALESPITQTRYHKDKVAGIDEKEAMRLLSIIDRVEKACIELREAILKGNSARRHLGIPLTATPEEAKKAYWARAKREHPDVNGGDDYAFKKTVAAYEKVGG